MTDSFKERRRWIIEDRPPVQDMLATYPVLTTHTKFVVKLEVNLIFGITVDLSGILQAHHLQLASFFQEKTFLVRY